MRVLRLVVAMVLGTSPALAQSPAPSAAAMRFPQPVRVGDLPGRAVIEATEAQTVLGRVRSIVRDGGGTVLVVVELSRWFGLHSRIVAVPVHDMALLGDVVEPMAHTPAQLWRLPAFDLSSAAALGDDATIRVGLAKPSH